MITKEICCVVCPRGCTGQVTGDENGVTEVKGFSCPRGEKYGRDEFTAPKRMLTSTVRAEGYVAPVISVRSASAIPKELLLPAMQVLRGVTVAAPFEIGRVVVENILDCGVDIILANR